MQVEKIRTGEFIISEANGTRSRSEGVVASGEGVLDAGTVLGKVTASGKYVAYSNAASDGSEIAVAVLYSGVDATDADANAVFIDCDAELIKALLTGSDSSAVADLATLGIKLR